MSTQPDFVLGFRFGRLVRREAAGLFQRALYIFPLFYLFDFRACLVRHPYRFLT